MASLALGLVGGYLFGPVGYLVGSFLGNLLDPPKTQGPRLSDLKLQASQYGGMIPLQWGSNRIAGTVIWQTDLIEHSHTSGGKGGPQVTTYTYTASFAIALVDRPAFMGPISSITRIWADKRLIFDVAGLGQIPCKVYLGDQAQVADPTMEADLGAGNVPGFRDTVYVVFADYDLTQFYNRIPSFEFEVNTVGAVNGPIVGYRLTIDNTPAHIQPNPIITSWATVDSGTVSIGDFTSAQPAPITTPADSYDYNGDPSLAWAGAGTPGAWPQPIDVLRPDGTGFFGEIRYHTIGFLTTSDGASIPLWLNDLGDGSIASGANGVGPIIVSQDFDTSALPGYGIDYAADIWGLPFNEYIGSVVGTADNTALFIFTAPISARSGAPVINKWYKIVNNAIQSQGTVNPAISQISLGNLNRASTGKSSCFENNGVYCWTVDPSFYITGHANGAVYIYSIDSSGNFAFDSVGGYCPLDYLDTYAVSAGTTSIIAIGTGFAGVRTGNMIGIYRRTIPYSDEVLLSKIVSDVSQLAGLTTGQLDVTQLTDIVPGYTIASQMTARNMIQPLRNAYFFDGVESTGILKFPKRTNPSVATIPQDDLAAFVSGSTPPPLLQEDRTQDVDIAMRVTVNYLNLGADYQQGSQYSQRQVTNSQSVVALDLPIVLPDVTAAAMAIANLTAAWVERTKYTFYTSRKYAYLEPTDVVIVQGREMRIITMEEVSTTTIKFEGLGTVAQVYQQAGGVSAPATGQPPPIPPSQPQNLSGTNADLLDIPYVIDADNSIPNGFYSAMAPSAIIATAWPGGILEKSTDLGVSYTSILTTASEDTFGATNSIMQNFFGGNIFDELNSVTVTVASGETLSGATQDAVLNGANAALVGSEIIQYKNATLVGTNQYTLTGILRGRRGTEWAMAGHAIGERFIAFPVERVMLSSEELFLLREYKAITSGAALSTAQQQNFVNTGQSLRPYTPVQLAGGVDASGNVTLTWVRRTRIGGSWVSGYDVPLSEATELYVVQIWNSAYSKCARVITGVTSPSVVYTAAQQVTDFGAQQKTIYFTVGQIGGIGIGAQARGSAPGAGASNVDPLAPISPYGSPTYGAPPVSSGAMTLIMQWQAGWNSYTSGIAPFPCGMSAVFQFTTGPTAVNGAIGYVTGREWPTTESPVIRTACLSNVAGDMSGLVFPNSLVVASNPTIQFSLGTNPYGYPQLAINTTYYFNVLNTDSNGVCTCLTSDCAMRVSLVKPPGT